MKKRLAIFLPKCIRLFFVFIIVSSCGIEDYIYLVPVQTPTQTSQDEIPVVLPNSDQPEDFFSGYSIYYKIYTSSTYEPTVITSSQFSAINPFMASDYVAINPHLSVDAVPSISMIDFFNSLNFHPLKIKTEDEKIIDLLLDGTDSSCKLQKTENGFEIEVASNKYILVRNVLDNPAFTYSSNISGNDVNITDGHETAYALFFIFAYGVDEYGSPIFSRPTMLGVLQLPLP